MPKSSNIQHNFRAGEISPRLEFQDQQEGRKQGVELMENWDVHLQGSAETSHGAEFMGALTQDGMGKDNVKLLTFNLTPYTSFKLVLTPLFARLYHPSGPVQIDGVNFDPYFLFGSSGWTISTLNSGSVKSNFGAVGIFRDMYTSGLAYISKSFTVTALASYKIKVCLPRLTGLCTVKFGASLGSGSIRTEYIREPGEYDFTGVIPSTTILSITIEAEQEDTEITISHLQLWDESVTPLYAESATVIRADQVGDAQGKAAPPREAEGATQYRFVITSGSTQLYQVLLTAPGPAPSVTTLGITSPPDEWVNTGPKAVEFYGGRMWLGGCLDAPANFWASTTTDFFDFTIGVNDDDALAFALDDGGLIQWIKGAQGRGLLMGTSKAEHSIFASGGVITPSDIASAIQSTHGSAPIDSVEVGSQIAFVTRDGRKIRSTEYDWQSDVWKSRDLTYASEHLTKGQRSIRQIVYADSPNSRVIALLDDGELIQATYDPFTGVIGFSRRVTDGRVLSIAVAQSGGVDELWWIVDRGVDTPQYSLERIQELDNIKLDSYSILRAPLDITGEYTTISGGMVPQLAGKACQVVLDGAVHTNVYPNGSGLFVTEYAGEEIRVGLQILSTIRTLPIATTIEGAKTDRSMRKRLTEIWTRILSSWRPKINGWRPPDRRVASLMGEVEPAITESFNVSNEGWSQDAQVTIEQDLPLKTEIPGWFGRLLKEEV